MNTLSGSVHITMLLQTTGTDENCRLTEAKAAMDLKQGPVGLRILTLTADHNQLVFLTCWRQKYCWSHLQIVRLQMY